MSGPSAARRRRRLRWRRPRAAGAAGQPRDPGARIVAGLGLGRDRRRVGEGRRRARRAADRSRATIPTPPRARRRPLRAVNLARWMKVDPEESLRTANHRWVARYRRRRTLAAQRGSISGHVPGREGPPLGRGQGGVSGRPAGWRSWSTPSIPGDPRVRRQCDALIEAGHEVDVICLRRPGEAPRESMARCGSSACRSTAASSASPATSPSTSPSPRSPRGAWRASIGGAATTRPGRDRARLPGFRRAAGEARGACPSCSTCTRTCPSSSVIASPIRCCGRFAARHGRARAVGRARRRAHHGPRAPARAVDRARRPPERISVVMNSADPRLFDPARHQRRPFMADGELRLIHHSSLQRIYGLDRRSRAVARPARPAVAAGRLRRRPVARADRGCHRAHRHRRPRDLHGGSRWTTCRRCSPLRTSGSCRPSGAVPPLLAEHEAARVRRHGRPRPSPPTLPPSATTSPMRPCASFLEMTRRRWLARSRRSRPIPTARPRWRSRRSTQAAAYDWEGQKRHYLAVVDRLVGPERFARRCRALVR